MAGVAKQIIGSFEDIGKDIVHEAVEVPKAVAQTAMEALGVSSSKGQKGAQGTAAPSIKPSEGALGQIEQTNDQKVKQAVAREALAQLAGPRKQKEPTVQERLEQEQREKNEKEAKQANVSQKMAPISSGSSKPRRGDPYSARHKKTAIENKSARQD